MSYTIDLHMHSDYSDGTLTPTQVVAFMHSKGMKTIALTDHDHIGGIAEAMLAAQQYNMTIVPGIEFTTSRHDVLGHFFDPHHSAMQSYIKETERKQNEAIEQILDTLKTLGYPLQKDEIVGRGSKRYPNVATALWNKGYFNSFEDAYRALFTRGKPCRVDADYISPEEAFDIIHKAGGVAIIPHPVFSKLDTKALKNLLDAGADGIEVYHHSSSPEKQKEFREFAVSNNALISLGSDFHGTHYFTHNGDKIIQDLQWVEEKIK